MSRFGFFFFQIKCMITIFKLFYFIFALFFLRQIQINETINLAALTKIFDYFYENQYGKNDEIINYLNMLKERHMM